ncbi:MAG: hypothetical protein NT007_02945 [Candidatus Kapabacteria bacterium]|nr:hypothetical protein [Candidatus Kapabacteria bacterium]
MLIIYGLFTILERYPHIYNYVVEIIDENAEAQYTAAVRFLRILKLEICLLFSFVIQQIIASSGVHSLKISFWFIPVFILAIFISIAIYIRQSLKL